jgi:hypothetical protein
VNVQNIDVKSYSGDVLEGNEDHIGNWKKDDPCHKMGYNLVEEFSSIL